MTKYNMNLKEYFKDDKILVTGASGLAGRNVYEYLKNQGLNVIGIYNNHPKPNLVHCDLRDYEQTRKLLDDYDVKYVFMFANTF